MAILPIRQNILDGTIQGQAGLDLDQQRSVVFDLLTYLLVEEAVYTADEDVLRNIYVYVSNSVYKDVQVAFVRMIHRAGGEFPKECYQDLQAIIIQ